MRLVRFAFVLAVVLALLSDTSTAVRLTVNSSLIAKFYDRGHKWGSLGQQEFNQALIELASQRRQAEDGGLPTCGGLVDKLCVPCPDGGPEEFCQSMIDECSKIFCTPMCKRQTWSCEIDFGSFEQEAGEQERYQDALCSHFINEGCSTILDCCPRDDFLRQDVADKVYRDGYPVPALPTPSCVHDPAGTAGDDLCGKCNAEVKVSLAKKECTFPPTPGPHPSFIQLASRVRATAKTTTKSALTASASSRMSLEELYARDEAILIEIEAHADLRKRHASRLATGGRGHRQHGVAKPRKANRVNHRYASLDASSDPALGSRMMRDVLSHTYGGGFRSHTSALMLRKAAASAAAQHSPAAAKTLVEASASTSTATKVGDDDEGGDDNDNGNARRFGDDVPGFPGKPTYYGLNDRCNQLADRVEGMFGGMESKFQDKLCNCMGCCIKEGEETCFFPLWEVIASAPGETRASGAPPALFLEQSAVIRKQRNESRWAKYWREKKLKDQGSKQTAKDPR